MSGQGFERIRDERGVSLIEILIGVVILSITLLGLAAAGGVAARHVYMGSTEMQRWAAVQEQLETLRLQGFDNLTAGSDTIRGYPISWTHTGDNPKKVVLSIERQNFAGETVHDTLVYYIADPDPDS